MNSKKAKTNARRRSTRNGAKTLCTSTESTSSSPSSGGGSASSSFVGSAFPSNSRTTLPRSVKKIVNKKQSRKRVYKVMSSSDSDEPWNKSRKTKCGYKKSSNNLKSQRPRKVEDPISNEFIFDYEGDEDCVIKNLLQGSPLCKDKHTNDNISLQYNNSSSDDLSDEDCLMPRKVRKTSVPLLKKKRVVENKRNESENIAQDKHNDNSSSEFNLSWTSDPVDEDFDPFFTNTRVVKNGKNETENSAEDKHNDDRSLESHISWTYDPSDEDFDPSIIS